LKVDSVFAEVMHAGRLFQRQGAAALVLTNFVKVQTSLPYSQAIVGKYWLAWWHKSHCGLRSRFKLLNFGL